MLLGGKYEILKRLGAGGMGEVFKARHVHLNAFRCIKVIRPDLLSDDVYRLRFLREARVATQIHHPNVAVVHDFEIVDDGSCYMVTEFIDGTTLRQWAALHGRFSLPLAAEVGVQVLAGLDAIHRRGLLHRDVSADNVMLSYDDDERLVAKIIDLGVAKEFGAGPTDTTQTGMLVGNPKYMSPEQLGELDDGEQLDARADVYSFGIVLYEMIAGVPPFTSRTASGYIVKHLTERPPSLRDVQPQESWPELLESVLQRALEKKRDRRHPDARTFSAELSQFLARPAGSTTRSDVAAAEEAERRRREEDAARAAAEPADFERAWEGGSVGAWEEYLSAHAGAPRVREALRCRQEAAEFEVAAANNTMALWRAFLKAWPEGRHRLDAEVRLRALR